MQSLAGQLIRGIVPVKLRNKTVYIEFQEITNIHGIAALLELVVNLNNVIRKQRRL